MIRPKTRIWCYPDLSILGVVLIVGTTACVTWINLIVGVEGVTASPSDALLVRVFMSSLWFALISLVLSASRSAFSSVVFTNDGIVLISPFCKKLTCSYDKYRFIYRGQYFHGNMFGQGVLVEFIIFSQKKISTSCLYNANRIESTSEVIKIKYTPKRYERIYATVPTSLQLQLKQLTAFHRRL